MRRLKTIFCLMICAALVILPVQAGASALAGDVDGSGAITASDARRALRASARLIELTDAQSAAADVDQDGNVTATDARLILRYSAKLIRSFIELPYYTADIVPEYSGEAYVTLNNGHPEFPTENAAAESFESYGALDTLGRCTCAYACVGTDLMPTGARGNIRDVKPSGWIQGFYDFVDGRSLYNRCHLIGYAMTAENANERNLITGTRYMNAVGMLPFEEQIVAYVRGTNNHVLYRVTPIFDGKNLVARGVQMEAWSVEDDGKGICFNIYCYNVQPGVIIDYATGANWLDDGSPSATADYIVNKKTKVFHLPSCSGARNMSEKNKKGYNCCREELLGLGYKPCAQCNP